MSSRQPPYGAGSRPRQPIPQGPSSQYGRGSPEETHQEYGAGENQDTQEQYHDHSGEGEIEQYGEHQGQGELNGEEHEDPHDEKKDEGLKGGTGAASDVGKLQHGKFPQDPHHSETMALFHEIACK